MPSARTIFTLYLPSAGRRSFFSATSRVNRNCSFSDTLKLTRIGSSADTYVSRLSGPGATKLPGCLRAKLVTPVSGERIVV